jgi:hypothetical protein
MQHVLYAAVPLDGLGKFAYVGITSQTAWDRHTDRLAAVRRYRDGRERKHASPFEAHLMRLGEQQAENGYAIMILEHVPREPEQTARAWVKAMHPYERYWINQLRVAAVQGGYNVEHTMRWRPGFDLQALRGQAQIRADLRCRTSLPMRAGQPLRWRRAAILAGRKPVWIPRGKGAVNGLPTIPPAPTRQQRRSQHQPRGGRRSTRQRVYTSGGNARLAIIWRRWSEGRLRAYVASLSLLSRRQLKRVVDRRLQTCDVADRRGMTMIRDTLVEAIVLTVSMGRVAVRRPLLVSAFVGTITEGMGLQRILQSEELRSLVPGAIWKMIGGMTLVVHKYFRTVGEAVFNLVHTSRNGVGPEVKCLCHEPRFLPYPGVEGHVVTKDLSIIPDLRLQELLRRGPKYRELVCDLLEPPNTTPDAPHATARDRVDYTIRCMLNKFAKDQEVEHDVDPRVFDAWTSVINVKVASYLDSLSQTVWDKLEGELGCGCATMVEACGFLGRARTSHGQRMPRNSTFGSTTSTASWEN